jgi:hypothetical protein
MWNRVVSSMPYDVSGACCNCCMHKEHKFVESGLIRGHKFKGTSLWSQAEYDSLGCGHCKTRRQNGQRTASGPQAAAVLTPENEML